MTDETLADGPELAVGTYEDGLAMIGHTTETVFGDLEVNWAMIRVFCGASEDRNPSYWDPDFADDVWGGIISPPALVHTWAYPLDWRPDERQPLKSIATEIPLPGNALVNVSIEMEFERPLHLGERVNVVEEVVSISPEKTTRLGTGHFIEIVATIRNQRGELVARRRNTGFRYTAVDVA